MQRQEFWLIHSHAPVFTDTHKGREQTKRVLRTCWSSPTVLPVHVRCGQGHLPTAALHKGLVQLPILPGLPTLPGMPILPFLPVHEGGREADAGRCIASPLADALRIKRQQCHKRCHLQNKVAALT